MGATRIIGEEALYVFHEGEGENFRLTGLVGAHSDDFNTMVTDNFHKKVTDKLQEVYVFGARIQGVQGSYWKAQLAAREHQTRFEL